MQQTHVRDTMQLVKDLAERGYHVVATCRQPTPELHEVAAGNEHISVAAGAHIALLSRAC